MKIVFLGTILNTHRLQLTIPMIRLDNSAAVMHYVSSYLVDIKHKLDV